MIGVLLWQHMRKPPSASASLGERAYVKLREKILKGEYPLGAAISRRQVAAEFGMSFLPVSEAVKRLEHDGLLESQPRVGTRVRIPTPQDLRDRCIVREALETQSARLFAEAAGPDQRLELRAMAVELDRLMESCGDGSDRNAVFDAQMFHLSFHMRIAECTGSALLCDTLAHHQVLIFNWLYDIAAGHLVPPRWHQRLMDGLAGTDPDRAERAMRDHVRFGFEEIQADIVSRYSQPAGAMRRAKRPEPKANPPRRAWRAKPAARG